MDFKKRVIKKDILSYSPSHRNKIHDITISSSKNDFLVFQSSRFPFLEVYTFLHLKRRLYKKMK